MGKRQIAEMQPFEFVVTLIIADLACIPMTDVSIPLLYGIVAIITLFIVHQIFSILEQSGTFIKGIMNGKPSIVINKDGVDLVELKRNNLGVDDLIESMRSSGYYSFDDLSYAIFESNGKLSPLENPNRQNNCPALPLLIINQGKINLNNIIKLNTTSDNLNNFLVKNNLKTKINQKYRTEGVKLPPPKLQKPLIFLLTKLQFLYEEVFTHPCELVHYGYAQRDGSSRQSGW